MDFIITWVNGNDPNWRREYIKHRKVVDVSSHEARFRDWDNLHFWFRGVEKFAPWVDKIHFITWGHLPNWLNTKHPKLNIVNHRDYIPEEYLPTFNSHTIELNFHRISDLSEEYVSFNDDVFIIDGMQEKDFFVNGKPCDMALFTVLNSGDFSSILFKNICALNRHFSKYKSVKQDPFKWLNFKYGYKNVIKNILLLLGNRELYTGFYNPHLAQPSRKSTLKLLWEIEYEAMNESCRNQFRNYNTVNPYLQRYWELSSNNFHPINMKRKGALLSLNNTDITEAVKFIINQEKPLICINDHIDANFELTFEEARGTINSAFNRILPDRSSFEI